MSLRDKLLGLQWAQLKHDEAYHKDVVILPLAQRIKHMALHNAKYTAYFFEALDTEDADRLSKTLVDAFIIALASANTLNQDLGKELSDEAAATYSTAATASLAQSLPEITTIHSGWCGSSHITTGSSPRFASPGTI